MKMFTSRQSLILIVSLMLCGPAIARPQAAMEPSAQPAPTLERINNETQALYEFVRPGLVRVQLPVPKWMADLGGKDNPLNKWDMDPKIRDTLGDAGAINTVISPTTPATQSSKGSGTAPSTQPAD